MDRHAERRGALAAAGLGAATLALPAIRPAFAQGAPIRVGVLHSLSGTMAISETALRDTVLMMVEWINGKGGILGRRVEAVVVDPASNWPLFAEKARELIDAPVVGDRVLGLNPETGKEVIAKDGRFGPYVTERTPESATDEIVADPATGEVT